MPNGIWFWVLVFAIPIVAIVMGSLEKISRNRALMRLAESGKPIPPELFRGMQDYRDRRSSLRGGFIVMFAGLGLAIFFWGLSGASGNVHGVMPPNMDWLPAIGAIPFMVGLGIIIGSLFQKDDDRKD